jgi:hypothetical protein
MPLIIKVIFISGVDQSIEPRTAVGLDYTED